MKAAFFEDFGELDNITIGERDKPEPAEGEVLVRIKAAGVNPVDAAVAQGMLEGAIPTEFPAIPGWDMAGVVEECGHAARRFEEGDEVYAYARRPLIRQGTFAEYTAIPESYLAKRPQGVSMEEAGGIPLVGLTAYQSLFDAGNLSEGETLVILGASGGVGSMAIQLAKTAGARVIGVASAANHDYMKKLGADETVDYNDTDVGEAVAELATDGVDLIFHCSRGTSLEECVGAGLLEEDGRLVSITKSQPDIPDGTTFHYVFVEPHAPQLERLAELADEGKLRFPVTETFTLEETEKALQQIASLHTRGKLIITP